MSIHRHRGLVWGLGWGLGWGLTESFPIAGVFRHERQQEQADVRERQTP